MIYSIVKYGDPVLETKAETVSDFDTPELHKLLDDMFESMYAARGVGLAGAGGDALAAARRSFENESAARQVRAVTELPLNGPVGEPNCQDAFHGFRPFVRRSPRQFPPLPC